MTTGNYPVIEERSLPPVARPRAFRNPWRDPAGLPPQQPGCVYVFEYDGYYRNPPTRRVTGREPYVVAATAVSLVQVRDHLLTVRRSVPSARAGANLLVSVTFRCVVTDPIRVAGNGLMALDAVLATHVAGDRELGTLGRDIRPEYAAAAVLRIEAQLRAYCTVNPPEIAGVDCVVAAVEVHAQSTATPSIATQSSATDVTIPMMAIQPELSLHQQVESRLAGRFGQRRIEPQRDDEDGYAPND